MGSEGGFFGVAGGNRGRLRAPQQHYQLPAKPFSPFSTDPKISAYFNVRFTSSRSNTEDTPEDLRTSWTQHRNSRKFPSQGAYEAPLTLYTIILGVGGTININHTLLPFKDLCLDSQGAKKLASKLHLRRLLMLPDWITRLTARWPNPGLLVTTVKLAVVSGGHW